MPENNKQPLSATDFTPLGSANSTRRLPLSPRAITLLALAVCAMLIMLYLTIARAVIFQSEPNNADIAIDGLSFNLGTNYLLLSGDYKITASASGYYPLTQTIQVSEQDTQRVELQLQPLPGNLDVSADLTDISTHIDGQPTANVPGIIEGISRGTHQIEFSKYRYFPLQQQIDIVGLGTTQSLDISLRPAWGQMQFDSQPQGADLYIDNRLIGKTPLTTEVLETGSALRLAPKGLSLIHI